MRIVRRVGSGKAENLLGGELAMTEQSMHATRETGRKKCSSSEGAVGGPAYQEYNPTEAWRPAVNLYEDAVQYHVVIDLSGVDPGKIEVETCKGQLLLSGYRPTPRPIHSKGEVCLHHMEIDHGAFHRSIDLPDDVDVDAIEAVYRGGQLCIRMPKKSS
jgi:HSP20 family molecular chaperone IbpA